MKYGAFVTPMRISNRVKKIIFKVYELCNLNSLKLKGDEELYVQPLELY